MSIFYKNKDNNDNNNDLFGSSKSQSISQL